MKGFLQLAQGHIGAPNIAVFLPMWEQIGGGGGGGVGWEERMWEADQAGLHCVLQGREHCWVREGGAMREYELF